MWRGHCTHSGFGDDDVRQGLPLRGWSVYILYDFIFHTSALHRCASLLGLGTRALGRGAVLGMRNAIRKDINGSCPRYVQIRTLDLRVTRQEFNDRVTLLAVRVSRFLVSRPGCGSTCPIPVGRCCTCATYALQEPLHELRYRKTRYAKSNSEVVPSQSVFLATYWQFG